MSEIKIEYLGCAGHFIAAASCRFRLHTQITTEDRGYRVSTVGDLYFEHDKGKRQTLGAGENSFFETYVFPVGGKQSDGNEGCGCREVSDWSEIEGRRTSTSGEAREMHEEMVERFTQRLRKEIE